jgi:hypothetical protein
LVYNAGSSEITYQSSSIKYKKNITDLTNNTSNILNIRPREYKTKIDDKDMIGYIAEELEDIDDAFVWKNKYNKTEGINWFNMLIYAIEELKKVKSRLDVLEGVSTQPYVPPRTLQQISTIVEQEVQQQELLEQQQRELEQQQRELEQQQRELEQQQYQQ